MNTISWQDFRQKASIHPQRIVLADGEDPRVIQAAVTLQSQKIVHPWLVGSRDKIKTLWRRQGGKEDDFSCLDWALLSPSQQDELLQEFKALPKYRQLSTPEALDRIKDPLLLGALFLKHGDVDGFVGGATRTTADTLKAVFSIVGLAPKASTLFGFFLLERRGYQKGDPSSLVLLADCAVIPDPSVKQLAQIGVGAAEAWKFFMNSEPKVVFLSFSTGGSAEHPFVEKIRAALKLAREKAPQIAFEGEWQADAALDPFIAQIKGVGSSPLSGKANILIAPDLNTGNIAYKLIQRLGQNRAVGPVLWGMAQPANDLSRGCSAEDVVDMAALTALQAQAQKQLATAKSDSGKNQ